MRTFTDAALREVVRRHGMWLLNEYGGEKADLRSSNLSYSNLRGSNLRGSDLSGSDLRGSDLSGSNLSGSNLRGSDLSGSNLRGSNLRGSDLSYSNLSYSNLSYSNLRGSDLRGSDLSGSNLSGSNLSGSKNLPSQQAYMQEHFEHDRRGFIVYKTFGGLYTPPATWRIEPGAVIEEVVNPDRCTDCGSGVNVATLEWVKLNMPTGDIWKCRIAWKDAPGIVVPYMTDGKIRAERVELIEVVPR